MNVKVLALMGGLLFSGIVMASPVNVNSASVEEIAAALKGVGPAKAMAISSYCKEQKCSKPEDLLNVKGIGQGTLEKIKDDLRFK
ncbi:helix-hairpin-helix domain-containing protein [Thiomicrorhabdus sp. ZW0627]|uniref:ComEA family DNA-binding protein n=1 Tax=Thiomicrorhabdus sp. ZW0627 TaxID=3039774 RepID=UPI00243739C2|nr:helix-hairpin-helix domain-containing protein [Thiomicrorhabdus sp. ZW0627]MDG6773609.1 helix-hairpin-helix domain-containing protein [Thiomicrorhabdus sp. ZW0627]